MSFWSRTKKVLKPAVDVPRWMGYQHFTQINRALWALGKTYFIPEKLERKESFTEAVSRLQLTEDDLVKRQKTFTRLMIIWMLMSTILLSYTIYIVLQKAWLSLLPALALSGATLVQTFRYHFWLFQIKHRKLGYSLREWFEINFKRRSAS